MLHIQAEARGSTGAGDTYNIDRTPWTLMKCNIHTDAQSLQPVSYVSNRVLGIFIFFNIF